VDNRRERDLGRDREHDSEPDIATVAALLGEPARARMLTALMEGRALTATELALEARVAPSTASSHLGRLLTSGLVTVARQGRHRYFRLAGEQVAAALEGLMALAPPQRLRARRPGPRDAGLRRARICYDHLAGELAVGLLARLQERELLRSGGRGIEVTPAGVVWLADLGVDVEVLRARRRPLCLPCLDWSERRFHLAGALGAALLERLLALRLLRRQPGSRAVAVSPRGEAFVASM
jgi:DNA-binding transcriptional ArsR family regulator